MSLDLNVYVESIDDQIIPKWMERMNEFEMDCEIHPDFSFTDHRGFLPFKIKLTNPTNRDLEGRELISGFEFYMKEFDFQKEIGQNQAKQTLFQKLLGKTADRGDYVNPEIDARLQKCRWVLVFNWGSHNSLELRMSSLSSAIIAELTDGVCCYRADDVWYNNESIVENAFRESLEFENSLKPSEWKVHEFEGWNE